MTVKEGGGAMNLHWVLWDQGRTIRIPLRMWRLAFSAHRAAIRRSEDTPMAPAPTLSLGWRRWP